MDYLFEPANTLPPVYVREVYVDVVTFIAIFGHLPAAPQVK
jgi:hypothetical protein